MTRRHHTPTFPIATGPAVTRRAYRVQVLIGRANSNRVWGTVLTARPAVAERIHLHMRTDGRKTRLVQR